MAIPLLPMVL